jgi:hypothetical protein
MQALGRQWRARKVTQELAGDGRSWTHGEGWGKEGGWAQRQEERERQREREKERRGAWRSQDAPCWPYAGSPQARKAIQRTARTLEILRDGNKREARGTKGEGGTSRKSKRERERERERERGGEQGEGSSIVAASCELVSSGGATYVL